MKPNDLPVNLPRRELRELLGPVFSYALAEAPVQQREALVEKICQGLLRQIGTVRTAAAE